MPPANRNEPVRGKSSDSTYSLFEFMRTYPDDATCLDFLWRERFAADGHTTHCPKCDQARRFHRVQSRPSYSCDSCGRHIHPTAGTIFEKSSTSLHLWFYAMYLMTSTRCGVSAKHLERELGVTYKTAWRMFNKIRNQLMAADPDDEPLSGTVEIDETSWGGKPRKALSRREAAMHRESKPTVFAAVERGGRIRATVVPGRRGPHIEEQIINWVRPDAIVMTDEWPAYSGLGEHFVSHSRVIHSAREYARGDTNTNTVEGFFGNLKTGMRGNYKKVSEKWLQGYLNGFCWRYNQRGANKSGRAMFEALLRRATTPVA